MNTTAGPLPREHVHRPDYPWRASKITECGRDVDDVKAVISRTELLAKIRRDGIQRAAYTTCMVCLDASRQWPEWDQDPVKALSREFYSQPGPQFSDELRAIAALVTAHREEFDAYLHGLSGTVSLDAHRARKNRSA